MAHAFWTEATVSMKSHFPQSRASVCFLPFQIVRMFMIVVATFAVFWLPYQVYFVYIYHDSSLKRAPYVQVWCCLRT